jgi:hypothetical protein
VSLRPISSLGFPVVLEKLKKLTKRMLKRILFIGLELIGRSGR